MNCYHVTAQEYKIAMVLLHKALLKTIPYKTKPKLHVWKYGISGISLEQFENTR